MNDAWAAGFFDGEGSILITHDNRRPKNPHSNLRLVVAQVDPTPIAWFKQRWGGASWEHSPARGRRLSYWSIDAVGAATALKDMLPYLMVKREQAELAIMFYATMKYAHKKVPDDVLALRADIYQRIRALKWKHYDSEKPYATL